MQCNDVGAELPTFTHHVDIIAHTVHVTITIYTMHNGYDSIYINVYLACLSLLMRDAVYNSVK